MNDEEPQTLLELYKAHRKNGMLADTVETDFAFISYNTDRKEINELKSADARIKMMEEIHKIMVEYPDDPIHLIYKEKTFPTPIYAEPVHCETVCTYYLLHG